MLAGAACVVVGNTGPAHLAAAVGTPVVSPVRARRPVRPVGARTGCRVRLGDQRAPCRDTRARACPVPGHPCLSAVDRATRWSPPCAALTHGPGPRRCGVKILLWHVHGSWTTSFVQGKHDYLVPVDAGPRRRTAAAGPGPGTGRPTAREVTPGGAARRGRRRRACCSARTSSSWPSAGPAAGPASTCPPSTSSTTPRRATSRDTRHPLADRDDLLIAHVTHFNDAVLGHRRRPHDGDRARHRRPRPPLHRRAGPARRRHQRAGPPRPGHRHRPCPGSRAVVAAGRLRHGRGRARRARAGLAGGCTTTRRSPRCTPSWRGAGRTCTRAAGPRSGLA